MSFPAYVEITPGRLRERFGLDFEDFAPGQRFKHRPGLTVTQQDNREEAALTLNQAMIHFDAHYAAQTEFKRPLVVTTFTVQSLIGMTWKTFAKRERIAGFASIEMIRPIFADDTLYAESEIMSVHDRPGSCGRLTVATEGLNQRGEIVCRMVYDALVWRRAQAPLARAGY
jgi:itaconyl-CoA hydratase